MEYSIGDFLLYLESERSFSPNTISAYRNDLQQLALFLTDPSAQQGSPFSPSPCQWSKIEPTMLQFYVASLRERQYADATIARKVASVRSFFNFLKIRGLTEDNPAEGLGSLGIRRSLPRTITSEEAEKLLEEPGKRSSPEAKRDQAMLHLIYATGIRVTELVKLDCGDLALEGPDPYIRCMGRGNKPRIIPLPRATSELIKLYVGEARLRLLKNAQEQALFLNRRGERLTRQGLWLILKNYAKAAGIEGITPHVLRHTFAAHMLRSGRSNLRDVQKALGHVSISTTQVYAHLVEDRSASEESRPGPQKEM